MRKLEGFIPKLNNTDFRSAMIFGCFFDHALLTDNVFDVSNLPIRGSRLEDSSQMKARRERQIAKEVRDFLRRKNARGNPRFWPDFGQTGTPGPGTEPQGEKPQS